MLGAAIGAPAEAERIMDMNHVAHKPFTWIHPQGSRTSRCDLELYFLDDRVIAVASEREDDSLSGLSVTQGAPILAAIVVQKYGVHPDDLTWIEHYPEKKLGFGSIYQLGETYDRVFFQLESSQLSVTRWERLNTLGTRAFLSALAAQR